MKTENIYLYEFPGPNNTLTRSPEPGQQAIIDSNARFKVVVCGRRFGKALALDTPILTTGGYKDLSNISVGDFVFTEDGQSTEVIHKSPIYRGRKCYRVFFSDGTSIVADASHDWLVEDKKLRKNRARAKTKKYSLLKLTTEELSKELFINRSDGRVETNFSIPMCKPIQMKEIELPIDPYLIHFSTDLSVFSLGRKVEKEGIDRKPDVYRRFIVDIKPIKSVPVQCLTVDNPTHLFLAGKQLVPTHNSTLGINESIKKALSKPDSTVWFIAPTHIQAKSIAWRFLLSRLRLFPESIQSKFRIQENYLQVTFPNGSILCLKGCDNYDGLRGAGLDYVVLDEYAMDNYQRAPVWREIIRPALSDKMGGALFISTPKGFNGFYDLYAYADSGEDPDWRAWRFPTSACRHITKEELQAAERELGPDLFAQEYGAEFKRRSGLVYKEFDRDIHLKPAFNPMEIPKNWEMEVGMDFGAGHPTAAVFVLFDEKDNAYVVDEFYEAENSIDENAEILISTERKWMKKAYIRWGDCAGRQEIIEYSKRGFVLAPTPKGSGSSETQSVLPGIDIVKSRLRLDPVSKQPSLFITKNCVNLIKELENYKWRRSRRVKNTIEVDDDLIMENRTKDAPEKKWDDLLDSLRYVLQYHRRHSDEEYVKPRRYVPRNMLTGI